ncbi:hypothetical protein BG004_007658 [Podila humilis]|nr:hypothetical protein BG004_007658 [Podila humilis]
MSGNTDPTNATAGSAIPTEHPHKEGFLDKIADRVRRLSHHSIHSSHSESSSQHQHDVRDNEHDNAYVGEAGIVGAHAIPPQMSHSSHGSTKSPKSPKSPNNESHHVFGGPENSHDNAYISEAMVVGAHAIPPMTFHARDDLKEQFKQQNREGKQPYNDYGHNQNQDQDQAQAQAQPQLQPQQPLDRN